MNTDELVRSDHEAMLIVGSFAHSMNNPESWERFANRLFDEWGKRSGVDLASLEGRTAAGRPAATQDAQSGIHPAAANPNAAPTPDDGIGPQASG